MSLRTAKLVTQVIQHLVILGLFILGGCATVEAPDPCTVEKYSSIVMLPEGGDDALMGTSTAYQALTREMTNSLSGVGLNVIGADQVIAEFPEFFALKRRSFNRIKLAEVLRSSNAQPVFALLLDVEVLTQQQSGYVTLDSQLDVRVLNVGDAKIIDNFRLETANRTAIRPSCTGSCLDSAVVDSAVPLMMMAAEKVAPLVSCSGREGWSAGRKPRPIDETLAGTYELRFIGFDREALLRMEEVIVSFAGYVGHQVVESSGEMTIYWYESRMSKSTVSRHVNSLLTEINERASIAVSGNAFMIRRKVDSAKVDAEARRSELNDW